MPATLLKAGNHDCFGEFEPLADAPQEIPAVMQRTCRLLYVGEFLSGKGPVEVGEQHLDNVVAHHNGFMTRISQVFGAAEPPHLMPPMQLDHSTSARDTIGRMTGKVWKGVTTLLGGDTRPALFCRLNVLGRENVERTLDGRWPSVSAGVDLDTGKIEEITVTPFPAAIEAALLSAKPCEPEENPMKEKLKKWLMSFKKLSENDADMKLSAMDDPACEAMSKEMDDQEQLSSETDDKTEGDKPKAAMSAAAGVGIQLSADQRSQLDGLITEFRSSRDAARLTGKRMEIVTRLSRLRADARITPAEVKKIDVARLSAGSQETIDAVFKSYEDREPVIFTGLLGTAKATNLAELSRDIQKQQLERETLAHMSFTAKGIGRPTAATDLESRVSRLSQPAPAGDPTTADQLLSALDSGDLEAAKGFAKNLLTKLSQVDYPGISEGQTDAKAQLAELTRSVETMEARFESLLKVSGPALGLQTAGK